MSSTTYKHQEPKTREQYKKASREQKAKAPSASGERKRIRIRLIPIWLRIILFLLLIIVCAGGGAMFGYGVLGEGKPADVFKESTWLHIRDIVTQK
ncbi:DNA-directed RNA polymerase subunit beta [Neobacillus notoginsengisoli]|uniref:DNA-directed RNA polymerase subunit beta n=1 Tax=Neobacillus notoginsengisoli TaxID=1578198 RepID=A0A417YRJ7_9BACI|nr:DNA-directed RNA polymerase subunit beta [Neobacillus notoginsengisoli]RHW37223.1 DNA-directed RNA polymerase subunit beta [Neobacillus notoginsengisoli]